MTYATKDLLHQLYDALADASMVLARAIAQETGVFTNNPEYIIILMIILFAVWTRLAS